MKVVKNIVSILKYNKKCPYKMTPTRIVVHNTANNASAKNEIAYMRSNNDEVSFHYAVDDVEVVQGINENRNAWHAGDGGSGKGNREGIAIEICYSYCKKQVNGKWVADEKTWNAQYKDKFIKAEKNAVDLIVDILKRYNWGIDKVTKHQDYSGKYCPHRTLDMGWERFIAMVSDKLNAAENTYTVKKGDSLWKIAQEQLGNGARYNEIATLNGIKGNLIHAGQVLKLPQNKANTSTPKKSVEEIAKEVIQGKWGNGADRKKRLTDAGYDYAEVQKKVNQLLK